MLHTCPKTVPENSEKRITNEIKNTITKKQKLYKRFCKTRKLHDERSYRKQRNKTIEIITLAKKDYFESYLNETLAAPKKFYKVLNSLCGRHKQHTKILLNDGSNEKITDELEIANTFNEKFTGTVGLPIDPLHNDHCLRKVCKSANSIFFYPMTLPELENIIFKLRDHKATGLDGISSEILKCSFPVICLMLLQLCNESMEMGVFPDCLKISRVIPLHKKGPKTCADNYRSISLLSTVSEVLGKAVHNRVCSFVDKFKLLHPKQFGFRSGHSTCHALIEITERLRESEFQHTSVLLDLRKAFDTVNHERLLMKLEIYGIRGTALAWFESYLNNRYQCVQINKTRSAFQLVMSGVPQGSILGPLLFIIFMNDFPCVSSLLETFLFADDANCLHSIKKDELFGLNDELEKVKDWTNTNGPALNIEKTQVLQIGLPYHDVILDGKIIDRQNVVNYLGVYIDHKLNFSHHIHKVVTKTSKHLNVSFRLRQLVSRNFLIRYYNVYVKPIISYGLFVYGCTSKTQLLPVFYMQKKVLKIILCKSKMPHTSALFEVTGTSNVYDMYTIELLKFCIQSTSNLCPTTCLNSLFAVKDTQSMSTRSTNLGLFELPCAKSSKIRHSVRYRGCKLLNYLLGLNAPLPCQS